MKTLAAMLILTCAATAQDTSVKVWRWYEVCTPHSTMIVEVRLDRALLHRSSFPVCQVKFDPPPDNNKKIISFFFQGGHVFQGEYRTHRGKRIEGIIWQAGAEPDGMLLGVSFMTERREVLNTIHFAKPNARSSTEIDKGLVVTTFPVRSPRKSD